MLMADYPQVFVVFIFVACLNDKYFCYTFFKRKITYLKTENYMQVNKKSRLEIAKYSEVSV